MYSHTTYLTTEMFIYDSIRKLQTQTKLTQNKMPTIKILWQQQEVIIIFFLKDYKSQLNGLNTLPNTNTKTNSC